MVRMGLLKILKAPISTESKFLTLSLVFTILCHGAAMMSMLIFLLPGMPGGTADLAHRVEYIANHVFQWRLGWFPWQMTALSDLFLSVALVRTVWIPRKPAICSLAFTVLAILAEQPAEFRWITSGIDIAKEATRTGNTAPYGLFEKEIFNLTSHWAALFYTIAAIFWSIGLMRGKAWNAWMTRLSLVLWSILLFVSIGPLVSPAIGSNFVSTGNAIGFNLMMIWFGGTLYLVKSRPIK